MATIEKRSPRTPGGSVTYRVRYRDPAGTQRSKTFKTRAHAKAFKATVEADLLRGTYLDQALGKMTLAEYAEQWLDVQTFGASTRQQATIRLRSHILPPLGATPLAQLRTSQVQAWVRSKQQELAPRTVRVLVSQLSSILNAAVDDERIAKNPVRASSLRLPALDGRKLVPWTVDQVEALSVALPQRYALLLTLTTGLGLRQGEAFGLALEDIDFLRQTVRVRRQVSIIDSRLVFALPKGRKERDVPLPSRVGELITAHLQQYPVRQVSLPWEVPGGKATAAHLLVTTREAKPLNRNYVNRHVWQPALVAAGLPLERQNICMGPGTCTRASNWRRARASGRVPSTSGTLIPGSPCGRIPTSCRRPRTRRREPLTTSSIAFETTRISRCVAPMWPRAPSGPRFRRSEGRVR
jgi:integrase